MKIVCLVGRLPAARYFVNTIHRLHGVALVIEEHRTHERSYRQHMHQVLHTLTHYGLMDTLEAIADALRNPADTAIDRIHDVYFEDAWREIRSDIPTMRVEHINEAGVVERLASEQPDVIVDHGTSILQPPVIQSAAWALNLHWGLSPYYRGTHCTEWALINWDPYNIGVTIHKLAKHIDGGDIVAQQRAAVHPEDTAYTINMQLSRLGTDLMCTILRHIKNGAPVQAYPQETAQGFLTLNRQWSRHCRKQIRYIEKNRLIKNMLRHPARRERLPIVEL